MDNKTSIIQRHNDLFNKIQKAISFEDIDLLLTEVNAFLVDYESFDKLREKVTGKNQMYK